MTPAFTLKFCIINAFVSAGCGIGHGINVSTGNCPDASSRISLIAIAMLALSSGVYAAELLPLSFEAKILADIGITIVVLVTDLFISFCLAEMTRNFL